MFGRLNNRISEQRRAILRGVYEENLRLRNAYRPRRTSRRWSGRRLLVPIALLVVIAGGHLYPALSESTKTVLTLLSPGTKAPENARAMAARVPVAPSAALLPVQPAAARTTGAVVEAGNPGSSTPVAVSAAHKSAPAGVGRAVTVDAEIADPPTHAVPLISGKVNVKKLFGLSVKTIVIDAGHGGRDPGTVGSMGTQEKDITLDVARRVREKLEHNSAYRILLVRDEDIFIPVNRRADFANSRDTDLFISIHVNYLPKISTNAIETYYFGPHQDQHTRKLAERENQGSEYTLSEFERTIRNVQDTIKLQESNALARSIQRSLLENIRRKKQKVLDTGVRTAPFMVLLGVKAPSVLAEIASLSSLEAEQDLRKESYRDEIASYLAGGITHYLNTQLAEGDKHYVESKSRLAEYQ